MRRFLVEGALVAGAELRLSPEEAKHCTRVMRLGVGDRLLLSDGRGLEAEAEIISADKANGTVVKVLSLSERRTRPFRLDLLQATLKGPKMDWLVEKVSELGVDAVHLVDAKFCVAKGEKADRWRRLAQAATKQSGNPQTPEIHESTSISAVLARLPTPLKGFLLSPNAEMGLAEAVGKALPEHKGSLALAIGPEGGFSVEEEESFLAQGFVPCRLSSQILRGETAALAAVAIALHELELRPPPELC